MAECIMVQGTMSGVGKSVLCAALCRIFKQDGLRVAPFKSQNMALNSYVTRDGLEMGRAQVMQAQAAGVEPDVAVVRLPRISNFTDFAPLEAHPMIGVRYVRRPDELGAPDLLVLPGTKNTMNDLLWLRQSGLESAVKRLAANGTPVLGICGGYQMLGRTLSDPEDTEGDGPQTLHGLGLLPVDTVFEPRKTRTRVQGTILIPAFARAQVDDYEIHTGRTTVQGTPFCRLDNGQSDGCVSGDTYGTYLHGLFDSGEAAEALVRLLCKRKGLDYAGSTPLDRKTYLDRQYDLLADSVRSALDMNAVYRILEEGA